MVDFIFTGATGFLGKILTKILELEGKQVMDLSVAAQLPKIDLREPFQLPPELLANAFVHCAGKAHSVPRTKEEVDDFYKVNYEGTVNLCNAIDLLANKPQAFIFISTVAVYGLETGIDIREDFPLKGSTPYAESKIQAENFLNSWSFKNNISLLILRIPLIAGPNPPGNLGKMINAIKNGRYVSINKGRARRSAVLGEDIGFCISNNYDRTGTYNLSDDIHPTFRDFETVISQQLKKRMPLNLPNVAGKILGKIGDIFHLSFNSFMIDKMENDLTFSCRKAKEELNWKPRSVKRYFKIN